MRFFRKILMSAAAALCCLTASAGITDLPVNVIGGLKCYCYKIKPGDTLYSVMRELGTDIYTIVRYNPSAEDGLDATSTLIFPVDGEYAVSQAAKVDRDIIHEVKKGETLYGIARQYGTTPEALRDLNPQLADGLKAGAKIYIAKAQKDEPATEMPEQPVQTAQSEPIFHTIEKGETIYGLGKKYGVSEAAILAANPAINPANYRSGMVIVIPAAGDGEDTLPNIEEIDEVDLPADALVLQEADAKADAEDTEVIAFQPYIPTGDDYADEVDPTMADEEIGRPASIAVILPFMLHEPTVSRSAARYTEFYKGLLLAADTLQSPTEPIIIRAYDSAGSIDSVKAILRDPELLKMQVIIAPPDEAQFKAVAAYGKSNGIAVVNPFIVKDTSHADNPAVMQVNVPGSAMVDKAIGAMYSKFSDCTPVMLRRSGAPQEHADFADGLKAAFLANTDVTPVIITYNDNLTADNLRRLERLSGNLLFIPYEGKSEEAARYLPALASYAATQPSGRVNLAGYPEWVTFKNENRANLDKTNAVIYSRFLSDENDFAAMMANNQFVYWYGSPTEASYPRQGLLGLDLGMYLIKTLRDNGGDFTAPLPPYYGIQSSFCFDRPAGQAGLVNEAIYIMSYRPGGLIDRVIVE